MIGALAAPVLRTMCAPRATRFASSLADCAGAQRRALARILREAAPTERGRQLGLREDDDLDAFRSKAPVTVYADLLPAIERMRRGERGVLVRGRVDAFEPTSGSGGATKLIPYNRALAKAFRSLFAVWAHDLLAHVLRPRSGRAFVSVSPPRAGDGHARHDADYLGRPARTLVAPFLVAPANLPHEPEHFRDALARALLACRELEVVSVWSPTYFLVLLAHIERMRGGAIDWTQVWPRLQLVSCWTAAAAAEPAQRLAALLPHARVQGKGLLATEAPVTVPLARAGGSVVLQDEIVVELVADDGSACFLHEARTGREYELLLTQPGGLLRYRLGDRVRVTGRYRDAPTIEFAGRVDAVSDLVGEKLAEDVAAAALRATLPQGAFAVLVPDASAAPARYVLVTDCADASLGGRLDRALLASHRYREARAMSQLEAPRVHAHPEARRLVHDFLLADGMSAGDIKDVALLGPPARAGRLVRALRWR